MLLRTRQIIRIMVILGVLMNSGLFSMVAKAQDDSSGLWARWKMELDFAGEKIHAVWTVAIGEYDPNAWPTMKPLAQKAQAVECKPQGSFYIKGDEAIFDGKGYLECPTPSFYHEALALAEEVGGKLDERFMERCECVNPIPWLTGDLTVVPSESPNPIVYETNHAFAFYTPLTPSNDGTLQATSTMLLNKQPVGSSFAWRIEDKGNQIWSGTGTESFLVLSDPAWSDFLAPGFYAAASNTPADHFLQWENASNPQISPDTSDFYITNLATIFTIGYDGQHTFIGKIRKLAWDPGCTAH